LQYKFAVSLYWKGGAYHVAGICHGMSP